MSELLCSGVSVLGALASSWQGFKLMKKREDLKVQLAQCDGDDEAHLNLRLESHVAKKDMRELLKFWTVYALIMLYEIYLEIFVFWLPFYYTFKFALLLWVMTPFSRGAGVLFENLVEPHFEAHDSYIATKAWPAVKDSLVAVQNAAANSFIYATINLSSDGHLERVSEHIEMMAQAVRDEQARRADPEAAAAAAAATAAAVAATGASVPGASAAVFSAGGGRRSASGSASTLLSEDEEETYLEGKLAEARSDRDDPETLGARAASFFTGWFGGAAAQTAAMATAESRSVAGAMADDAVSESPEAASAAVPRSSSVGWVLNAFDGVVGLTVNTKEVLLGTRGKAPSSSEREEKRGGEAEREAKNEAAEQEEQHTRQKDHNEAEIEEEEEEEEDSSDGLAEAEAKLSATMAAYTEGFDALSECEDSDASPPQDSASRRSASRPPPEVSLDRQPRRGAPQDPLRRRRPATRSQAKHSS